MEKLSVYEMEKTQGGSLILGFLIGFLVAFTVTVLIREERNGEKLSEI